MLKRSLIGALDINDRLNGVRRQQICESRTDLVDDPSQGALSPGLCRAKVNISH